MQVICPLLLWCEAESAQDLGLALPEHLPWDTPECHLVACYPQEVFAFCSHIINANKCSYFEADTVEKQKLRYVGRQVESSTLGMMAA